MPREFRCLGGALKTCYWPSHADETGLDLRVSVVWVLLVCKMGSAAVMMSGTLGAGGATTEFSCQCVCHHLVSASTL